MLTQTLNNDIIVITKMTLVVNSIVYARRKLKENLK